MRNKLVFGRGGFRKRIVIIGEAPGPDEDRKGNPFIGRAGKILDKLMRIASLERNDTFICNVSLCYPGRNESGGFNKPGEEEIIKCAPRLMMTLHILKPKLIIALGDTAIFALISKHGVGQNRGLREYNYQSSFSAKLFISYHPSAVIRQENYKNKAKKDWKRIGEFLNGKKIKEKTKRATSLF